MSDCDICQLIKKYEEQGAEGIKTLPECSHRPDWPSKPTKPERELTLPPVFKNIIVNSRKVKDEMISKLKDCSEIMGIITPIRDSLTKVSVCY